MKTTTVVPAGTYWVGDPCYSIPDSDWMGWLKGANGTTILTATYRGKLAVGVDTAYGDGVYYDQNGRSYAVDSGMIGLVETSWALDSMDLFNKTYLTEEEGTRYKLVLDEPTTVTYDEGRIIIGDLVINTNGDEEEDVCEVCGRSVEGIFSTLCMECDSIYICSMCGVDHDGEDADLCPDCYAETYEDEEED